MEYIFLHIRRIGCIKKYAMWSELPSDIWTNVFDAMETREDGLMASMACKTMNEACYQSRHWSANNPSFLHVDVSAARIPDIVRMFEKANWNAHKVSFVVGEDVKPKIFAKKIVKNLKRSHSHIFDFKSAECVDLTTVVKALSPDLHTVGIEAEGGWRIADDVAFPKTLKRIRMTHRKFRDGGHQRTFEDESELEDLVIEDASPSHILKTCCLKSLAHLKTLHLVNTNPHWGVDLPLEKFPSLRRIHMHNGSCSLFKNDGSELHIIGFAYRHHVRCLARRPWNELLEYFHREPRGEKDVHYMDDDEDAYAMNIDGQSIFVNDSKTPIIVCIDRDQASITIEDVTKEVYGSDYEDDESD